eukprot:scaffold56995_cov17-Tisochrysis_lutea.AAC.1
MAPTLYERLGGAAAVEAAVDVSACMHIQPPAAPHGAAALPQCFVAPQDCCPFSIHAPVFYNDKVLKDETLAPFFASIPMERQRQKQASAGPFLLLVVEE